MAAYHPGKFDPSREFVTTIAFRCNGRVIGKGYRFDKSEVNVRILGLLYEHRKIIYDDHPLAIRLLTKAARGTGKATGVAPATGGGSSQTVSDPAGGPSPATAPAATEEDLIARLMGRYNKMDLFGLAENIPGTKRQMTKEVLARILVRSGYGNS